jgi:cytoskeletal protein CcmA (bactofilin family)
MAQTFETTVVCQNDLIVQGAAQFQSLQVAGAVNIDGTLTLQNGQNNGSLNVNGNLNIDGWATIQNVFVNDSIQCNNMLTVAGDLKAQAVQVTTTLDLTSIETTLSATGGGGTTLPSLPCGYVKVKINGTDRFIPYYDPPP